MGSAHSPRVATYPVGRQERLGDLDCVSYPGVTEQPRLLRGFFCALTFDLLGASKGAQPSDLGAQFGTALPIFLWRKAPNRPVNLHPHPPGSCGLMSGCFAHSGVWPPYSVGPVLGQPVSCLSFSPPLGPELLGCCIWPWTSGVLDFSFSLPLTVLCSFGKIMDALG